MRITIHRGGVLPAGLTGYVPDVTLFVLDKSGSILVKTSIDTTDRDPRSKPPQSSERLKDALDQPLLPTQELIALNAPSKNFPNELSGVREASLEFLKPKSSTALAATEAKILIEVARSIHMNLVSDAYDRRGWTNPSVLPIATGRTAIDEACRLIVSRWSLDGNWIRMRAENWQFGRSMTVPKSRLQHIRDQLALTHGSFDALSDAMSEVTDHQIASTQFHFLMTSLSHWELYSRDQADVSLLRFWASQTPDTKRRLLTGEPLAFGSINEAGRRNLREFVFRHDDESYAYFDGEPSSMDAEWMKVTWPGYLHRGDSSMEDFEPTQQFPNGPPMDCLLSVHGSTSGALVVANASGWSEPLTEQMAVSSGYYKPGSDEFLVKPAREDRMFFTLHINLSHAIGYELRSFLSVDSAQPMSFSKLSTEVHNRLDDMYKSVHRG